jgi:hypothetical protein
MWLRAEVQGGRHVRRVHKIAELEQRHVRAPEA